VSTIISLLWYLIMYDHNNISVCLLYMLIIHPGLVGYDMAVKAAQEVYSQAGVTPEQVDVVELHDCFSTNELITYEALVQSIHIYMCTMSCSSNVTLIHNIHDLLI
jgi:hypothetical protein